MIREAFRGKAVVLTGSTGFLGTAVLEKILRALPDVDRVVLPVRAWSEDHARDRIRDEVLANPAFGPLRERLGEGGFAALSEKVRAVPMDVTRDDGLADADALAGAEIAIHCAATVSFDPPVDQAYETNLKGTLRFLEWVRAAGRPRFVHVSTAYTVGVRRGVVPELLPSADPDSVNVEWRAEIDAVRGARAEVERASRTPERLSGFAKQARREMGPAGGPAVARRVERIRAAWVTDRLVEKGAARARALGWPDVYALTKALTERALVELRGDVPLVIVRPSIVESALREPYPGWIRGFRMAEPVILAYGRGALAEFPGLPESIVDVVPVDLAVNAILAAAAAPMGEVDDPPVYHVVSGNRRPLRYRELFERTRDYYREHPLADEAGDPVSVPEWRFPGRPSIDRRLRRGMRAIEAAQKALRVLPASGRIRDAVDAVERSRQRVAFVGRYANLYGAYTEFEATFLDDRTRALEASLPEDERREFPFDPTAIDWRHYLQDLHLPAVAGGGPSLRRLPPPRVVVEAAPEDTTVLAVFDLEGTVAATNVIESYLWMRLKALPRERWPREIARMARRAPDLWRTEKADRGAFLRQFYRRFEGLPVSAAEALGRECFHHVTALRLAPEAVRRIREHRRAGHRVVLVTGALEFIVAPLEHLVDEVVPARLLVRDGRYTGELEDVPPTGEARAAWLRRYAQGAGADLSRSYAYADSLADLPFLETVGNPVAVNPDTRLLWFANRRRWPVESWAAPAGPPKVLIPQVTA